MPFSFRYPILLLCVSVFFISLLVFFSGYEWKEEEIKLPDANSTPGNYISLYASYNGEAEVARIRRAIGERKILLFGSSELTSREEPAIPYRFFNDSLHIPLLAIGHEGFQSLSVFTQLAGLNFKMEKYPLVILLSPGWFHQKNASGTALQPFFESAVEPYLYSVYFNKELPDEFKEYLGSYIHNRLPDIHAPSSILKALSYQYAASVSPVHKLVFSLPSLAVNMYCAKRQEILRAQRIWNNSLIVQEATSLSPSREFSDSSWNRMYAASIEEHKYNSSNNAWSVENAYYDAWLRNSGKKKIYPVSGSGLKEMQDLAILLKFLKYKKASPLFIIQPLNPFAYENLQALHPVMKQVEQEIRKADFSCLSLWITDTSRYVPGTLKDVMHFGAPGWHRVNKEIFRYYGKLHKQQAE